MLKRQAPVLCYLRTQALDTSKGLISCWGSRNELSNKSWESGTTAIFHRIAPERPDETHNFQLMILNSSTDWMFS